MSYFGTCNRCGLCCVHKNIEVGKKGEVFLFVGHCEHLRGFGGDSLLPYPTFCDVYDKREYLMPITMHFPNGLHYPSVCVATFPRPNDAIPPQCSYVWEGHPEHKPKWVMTIKSAPLKT